MPVAQRGQRAPRAGRVSAQVDDPGSRRPWKLRTTGSIGQQGKNPLRLLGSSTQQPCERMFGYSGRGDVQSPAPMDVTAHRGRSRAEAGRDHRAADAAQAAPTAGASRPPPLPAPQSSGAGSSLTVGQLVSMLRRTVQGLFASGVWVTGEIDGIARSRNGHVFFDLVERRADAHSGDSPAALIPVALFDQHRSHVNDIMRSQGRTAPITDGMRVRIHGRVDFHPARGRVRFKMDGIDPSFAPEPPMSERDDLLRRLHAEGLLRRNAEAQMPDVPLRVGLVTALDSAACADACRVLHTSGYAFELTRADTPVQGQAAAAAIARSIDSVSACAEVVLLVRGGGSKSDLAAFDHELVARAVASCCRPVFTGIGHQVDRSVADEAAHTSRATPTAAAAAVVEAVTGWLDRLERLGHAIAVQGGRRLSEAQRLTDDTAKRLTRSAQAVQRQNLAHLHRSQQRLIHTGRRQTHNADRRLDAAQARLQALDPARVLQRGWSLTRLADGTLLRSIDDAQTGRTLVTQLADGALTSTID